MGVTFRKYKAFSDFQKVCDFYTENYRLPNWFLTQSFFEYAHTHGNFNFQKAHHFGIWEENRQIIATACFEMDLGECFTNIKTGYEYLKNEILAYAEKELSKLDNGKRVLFIYTTNEQDSEFYLNKGYSIVYSSSILVYPYEKGFLECQLPDGFTFISLEDENDASKIDRCLWTGFHDEPYEEDWSDGRIHMQSGPNFRKDLTTIIKAPNGDYAAFAGIWIDKKNGYAYLEPLATVPEYRRMGLATAALMYAMKKTVKYGVKYCYCGSIKFYEAVGCEKRGTTYVWQKIW